ncbi:hypothetical protein [Rhodanobacter hydrolyticus]|uniref:Uncharacterized protein n=1 Tax=Rhodanobacter hydrolyticus TaxID=2250595 RepID=A0ABW8J8Q5_9GAMM
MQDSKRWHFHGMASLLLACPLALFLYFVRCTDAAMDKSGLGDVATWQVYQIKAGVAFWIALCTWMLLLAVAAFKRSFRSAAITACVIVPVVGVIAWLTLLVL